MPVIVPPHNESRKVANWITEHEVRLKRVEDGLRRSQLGNSSLNGSGLNYYDDDGNLRGTVGKQIDGTYTATSTNNPNPPPVPVGPSVTNVLGGMLVDHTGENVDGTSMPADFSHLNVYLADVINPTVKFKQGTISPVPGQFPITTSEYTAYEITVTSVNYSGKESEHSIPSTGTPQQAVSADLINGIIQEVHLSAGIVTEAAIQAGAVTTTKIADDAISTPKLAAGAVVAAKIAADQINAGHLTAGSITTEKIASLAITTNELAANAITATKIQTGAVTALKLESNLVLASRLIAGTIDGNRVEMHPVDGLQAWTGGGVTRSFWINAATGSAFLSGEIQTAYSPNPRIVINPGGTVPDEMRLYQTASTYGRILADPAPGSTAAVLIEGSGTSRGRLGVYPTEAFVSLFDGANSRSAVSCLDGENNIWGGAVNLEAQDQWGTGEIVFRYRNPAGAIQHLRTLAFRGGGSGEPCLYSGIQNTQIVWLSNGMIVQDGAGGGTRSFFNSSSVSIKKNVKDIIFGTRDARDMIAAVPSKQWNYQSEWIEGEPEPPRRKIKQRTDDVRDAEGRLVKAGEDVLVDAPPEPKIKPHYGPLAEDLVGIANDLLTVDSSIPGGYGLVDRDLIGVLWEALRGEIARNEQQKTRLQTLTDNFQELKDRVRALEHA